MRRKTRRLRTAATTRRLDDVHRYKTPLRENAFCGVASLGAYLSRTSASICSTVWRQRPVLVRTLLRGERRTGVTLSPNIGDQSRWRIRYSSLLTSGGAANRMKCGDWWRAAIMNVRHFIELWLISGIWPMLSLSLSLAFSNLRRSHTGLRLHGRTDYEGRVALIFSPSGRAALLRRRRGGRANAAHTVSVLFLSGGSAMMNSRYQAGGRAADDAGHMAAWTAPGVPAGCLAAKLKISAAPLAFRRSSALIFLHRRSAHGGERRAASGGWRQPNGAAPGGAASRFLCDDKRGGGTRAL